MCQLVLSILLWRICTNCNCNFVISVSARLGICVQLFSWYLYHCSIGICTIVLLVFVQLFYWYLYLQAVPKIDTSRVSVVRGEGSCLTGSRCSVCTAAFALQRLYLAAFALQRLHLAAFALGSICTVHCIICTKQYLHCVVCVSSGTTTTLQLLTRDSSHSTCKLTSPPFSTGTSR